MTSDGHSTADLLVGGSAAGLPLFVLGGVWVCKFAKLCFEEAEKSKLLKKIFAIFVIQSMKRQVEEDDQTKKRK